MGKILQKMGSLRRLFMKKFDWKALGSEKKKRMKVQKLIIETDERLQIIFFNIIV